VIGRSSRFRRSGLPVLAGTIAILVVGISAQQRPADPPTPTFATDVAPILYKNCATCHRPGQSAPFPLLSLVDARRHGDLIADVVESRHMPPWHAARAPGFAEFVDERRLSDRDLGIIRAWVAAGMPAGDMARAPKPPVFASGWALGKPDLVVRMSKPVLIPAEGADLYRNVVLTIDLPDDRWIRAVEFRPTAPRVVHHVLFFITPASATIRDEDTIPGAGGAARGGGRGRGIGGIGAAADSWSLGGWVPGITPRFFPDDIAQPFAKHSNLVAQLHLHPNGKAEEEHGELALYFAEKDPARTITGIQVPPAFGIGAGIDIPAGQSDYTIRDEFVLPVDVEAFGTRAHAHYLAKKMTLTATLPDGTTRGLLKIDDWDFGWQDSYFFKTPIRLPRGTTLHAELRYDNSADNLRNPHSPPQRVRWGRESFDEMGSMTLLVGTPRIGNDAETLRIAQAQQLRMQLLKRAGGRGGSSR
jgi:mono/diheme cytochrome c family protein